MTMLQTTTRPTDTTMGRALVDRLMAGDFDGAGALLSPDITFRAVTPRKFLEFGSRDDVVAAFKNWFKAGWREGLEGFEDGECENRLRMRYRVLWSDEYSERFAFEQHVYYECDDSGITWLELMCSGHLRRAN